MGLPLILACYQNASPGEVANAPGSDSALARAGVQNLNCAVVVGKVQLALAVTDGAIQVIP